MIVPIYITAKPDQGVLLAHAKIYASTKTPGAEKAVVSYNDRGKTRQKTYHRNADRQDYQYSLPAATVQVARALTAVIDLLKRDTDAKMAQLTEILYAAKSKSVRSATVSDFK